MMRLIFALGQVRDLAQLLVLFVNVWQISLMLHAREDSPCSDAELIPGLFGKASSATGSHFLR